ncbi:PREDICTED: uncharacterized protein LOC103341025 [Prunus mume]|uniref:Uncharacterized protein LOC103341025 n=1 Tax=Prunus mume TaxID=102107 RepID=A0ABM0PPX4_PRUMU|nr:PREDICTED: uncharacterized protein LOC103341025 [Prunus mume]
MPKDRRGRSVSRDRYRASPYPCSSSHTRRPPPKIPSETEENVKEWEDTRCPVCLEHPHNAVLLICSSYEKGCRPYMCDTSYRHSNCLDQYCKSFSAETSPTVPPEGENQILDTQSSPAETLESTITHVQNGRIEEEPPTMNPIACEHEAQPKLLCPLCRGEIKDWIIVEPARCFMNAKSRNCSCETCSFIGTYADLRKHARLEHPQARPSEADPERQRTWRSLERQRDFGDLLSTLQSSIGEDRGDDSSLPVDDGGWLTVVFLVRVIQPGASSRSSTWSGPRRTRAQVRMRGRATTLWGESYDGEAASGSREEDNDSSDGSTGSRRRSARLRRRTTPDNQP